MQHMMIYDGVSEWSEKEFEVLDDRICKIHMIDKDDGGEELGNRVGGKPESKRERK